MLCTVRHDRSGRSYGLQNAAVGLVVQLQFIRYISPKIFDVYFNNVECFSLIFFRINWKIFSSQLELTSVTIDIKLKITTLSFFMLLFYLKHNLSG